MAKEFRTINKLYEELLQDDPNTAISKHAIRQAVLRGEIPSRKAGQKFIVEKGEVLRFFSGEDLAALEGRNA